LASTEEYEWAPVNLLDVVVVVLALALGYRGWHKGLVGQVFELGGGFLGLLVGIALGPRIAAAFTDRPGLQGALISLLVVFVLLSIGQTAGYIVGHRGGVLAKRARLGGVNQTLGGGFGVIITVITFWLVGSLLVSVPSRPLARAFRGSAVLRVVGDVLPQPPNLVFYLRQYLDTSGFPQVFAGLPRPLAPQVDLPPGRDARAAAQAAQESTVRIVVPACGGTQLGSGWIAADSMVVTNAHVVAGGNSITVEDSGGRHAGRVVFFDPRTDVAIVRADGLEGRPLDLASRPLDRGEGGATLGFPGGGELATHAAAVRDRYSAVGLDIYGRGEVSREVYELRSPVRQGDSGGPFVLPNGSVAGVVFAASTTDVGTGYALTGEEVMDELEEGLASTAPVGTGRCTH
jgi:S1-C subfamily serine protease